MIHHPTQKRRRNWVASPPSRRNEVKYKMFPSVLSRCGTGSLETCTHIISRPKTYSLFISTAKTYYFYYLFYMGICVGFEQTIKHEIPNSLLRYYNELQKACPHKMASMFHQHAGSFVMNGKTCVNEDNDEMKEMLGITMFLLVSYNLFLRYCDRIQIAHAQKLCFH